MLGLTLVVILLCLPLFRMAIHKEPPFVPTSGTNVKTMMELSDLKNGETVYDLGCGDGRIVRAAAKLGGIATGYELSIPTFVLAKLLTRSTGHAKILYKDFWKADYRNADVMFCFLLPSTMEKFKEVIWPQLKPGARVVSHAFKLPGVEPKRQIRDLMVYIKP
jgi:SAM-dependent methyltransferase